MEYGIVNYKDIRESLELILSEHRNTDHEVDEILESLDDALGNNHEHLVAKEDVQMDGVFAFDVSELDSIEGDVAKCGCCLYTTDELFAHGPSEEEVRKDVEAGHIGICGRCYAEMLAHDSEFAVKEIES
jgi:hypothetical protein